MNRKDKYSKSQSVYEPPKHKMQQHAPAAAELWPDISRVWEQVGSPLRPSAQDISFFNDTINSWSSDNGAPRALILGVTPELYNMPWPNGTDILAVDHTQGMIDNVWPGPRNAVICADWTNIPLQTGSRDIVMCDGGVHLLTYPHKHHKFVQTLHRVIASDGLCIFRLFIPPKEREDPDKVLQDLLAAKISNLNLLKLRLDMAMHKDITQGVQLRQVWDAVHQVAPDFNRLASRLGWPIEHLLVINTYRDCPARYYFLGLDDVCHLFCESPGGFRLEAVHVPTYELGERCPTVVFRRIDAACVRGDG